MTNYRVLPFEWHEEDGTISLVRGAYRTRFGNPSIASMLELILADTQEPISPEMLSLDVAMPERPMFLQLIQFLEERRILVPVDQTAGPFDPESPRDVFFWDFAKTAAGIEDRLQDIGVAIVGINATNAAFCDALAGSGVSISAVIDDPALRNAEFFEGDNVNTDRWRNDAEIVSSSAWKEAVGAREVGCIVAASDFGARYVLNRWNERCLKHNLHFFPLLLKNYMASAGPLVIPGETPCYACYEARENMVRDRTERISYDTPSKRALESGVGFVPAMTSILGAMGSLELTKFYGGLLQVEANRVHEFNFIGSLMLTRPVLKIPRCRACSDLLNIPETKIHKSPGVTASIEQFYSENSA